MNERFELRNQLVILTLQGCANADGEVPKFGREAHQVCCLRSRTTSDVEKIDVLEFTAASISFNNIADSGYCCAPELCP